MNKPGKRIAARMLDLVGSRGGIPWCVILLAIYLAVTAFGVHHHQPWRDEAQKWLLARDAESVAEIWSYLPHEGTPALWPLLLRPLALAGVPYAGMSWLSWGIAGFAAALLLFAAPLPWPLKASILSSYWLLYQFSVPASNYSLAPFLLFAILAQYRQRKAHPLRLALAVVLLANSSVLGALLVLPVALMLGVETVRDSPVPRRRWFALGAIAAGFALLAIQLVPSSLGTGSSIENEFANPYVHQYRKLLSIVAEAVFPYSSERMMSYKIWGGIGFLCLLIVAAGMMKQRRALFLLVSASSLFMLLFTHVVSAGLKHTGFIFLVVVAALWMAEIERAEAEEPQRTVPMRSGARTWLTAASFAVVTVVGGLSFPKARALLRFETRTVVSRSRETAEFIRTQRLDTLPIVAFPAGAGSSLLPYLPGVKLYYPGLGEYGTFVRQGTRLWAGESALDPNRVLLGGLCRFPPGTRFLVLLGAKGGTGWPPYCRNILAPPHSLLVSLEKYWLFECNAQAADGRLFPRVFCDQQTSAERPQEFPSAHIVPDRNAEKRAVPGRTPRPGRSRGPKRPT